VKVLDRNRFFQDKLSAGLTLTLAKEIVRRRKHPFFTYKPDDHPERNQLGFHQSQAPIRLLFGGNQGGKSRAGAQEGAWWLTESHPHQKIPSAPRIYCVSAMSRTLQEGIWRHLKTCLPEWLIEDYGPALPGWQMPSFVRMKGGGQIDFITGEGGEDARKKVQAASIDLLIVDEEIDQAIWEETQARRLAREGRVIVCATLIRSEPWCLELEDKAELGDPSVDLFRLDTCIAAERGHVSKKVVAEMQATHTEEDQRVRLHGRSRRNEGLVYPEFSAKLHVCEPFKIPKDWTRYCALDPGWRTFGVLWVAVEPSGHYVVYRELYEHAKSYKHVADHCFTLEGFNYHKESDTWVPDGETEAIDIRWIDPSAFGTHESGVLKVGALLARYGLACAPARNDVEAGIELVRRAMMPGMDGRPKLRIFRTCESLLKEMRYYRRTEDTKNTRHRERPDKPVKRRDHLLDCLRYIELGGCEFRRADPDAEKMRQLDNDSFLNMPSGVRPVFEADWKRIMEKQRWGGRQIQHPGGLGSEY
jgi:phage terminase large subunit